MDLADKSFQVDSKNITERFKHLIGNSLRSDFTFHIEQDNVRVPAHKLIVSAGSTVLENIVYGTNQFDGVNSTVVDGISSASFMQIIRYLYTDQFDIENWTSAVEIIKKANYYCLPCVEQKCKKYLLENINFGNVCKIYDKLQLFYPFSDIIEECLRFVQFNGKLFLDSVDHSTLVLGFLKNILQLDTIDCDEKDLYKFMLKWAEVWCSQSAEEQPITLNKRKALDGAETLIRFNALTLDEFAEFLEIDEHFLSEDEIGKIKANISNDTETNERKRKSYTFRGALWTWFTSSEFVEEFRYPTSVTFMDDEEDGRGESMLCRVNIMNVYYPAKLYLAISKAEVFCDNISEIHREFELLVGNFRFIEKIESTAFIVPKNAVVIDFESNEEPIFIGRHYNADTREPELVRVRRQTMHTQEYSHILVCDKV